MFPSAITFLVAEQTYKMSYYFGTILNIEFLRTLAYGSINVSLLLLFEAVFAVLWKALDGTKYI